MAIQTQQSISGFIATQPKLTVSEHGISRFHARIGIEHSRQRRDSGKVTGLSLPVASMSTATTRTEKQ